VVQSQQHHIRTPVGQRLLAANRFDEPLGCRSLVHFLVLLKMAFSLCGFRQNALDLTWVQIFDYAFQRRS
jgi:hypothetical protein